MATYSWNKLATPFSSLSHLHQPLKHAQDSIPLHIHLAEHASCKTSAIPISPVPKDHKIGLVVWQARPHICLCQKWCVNMD